MAVPRRFKPPEFLQTRVLPSPEKTDSVCPILPHLPKVFRSQRTREVHTTGTTKDTGSCHRHLCIHFATFHHVLDLVFVHVE